MSSNTKGSCFVIMGFDKKTDFETGRTLDLNKSYRNMIKPAVEAAGLTCLRADEIVHSGVIDVPMYQQLLNADIVIADLSTSNKNAFYELGVRHALRPYTTIIIAEDGIKPPFPFDLNHISIRQYHHLGEDIGFDEVMRFRAVLTNAITEIMHNTEPRNPDSPVYTFLTGLKVTIDNQPAQDNTIDLSGNTNAYHHHSISDTVEGLTHSVLIQQVDEAQKRKDWSNAKRLLGLALRQSQKDNNNLEDPYLLQRLALVTYKSKYPSEKEALEEARNLLQPLMPQTSNDTETLGLWSTIHKRLWFVMQNESDLDEAILASERGYYLRKDPYNGINLAFLLNVRSSRTKDAAWAIADFIQARRIRQEVVTLCKKWLAENPEPQHRVVHDPVTVEFAKRYNYILVTLVEAYFGLDEELKANRMLKEAFHKAPEGWMPEATMEQLNRLKVLLADSPLRFIAQTNEQ